MSIEVIPALPRLSASKEALGFSRSKLSFLFLLAASSGLWPPEERKFDSKRSDAARLTAAALG